MNRHGILKNNKGATLVLVIVAMMFVGIIASIVLTLTVGNNKSAKATMDTSKNFYSSESVLDDLSMYFKKIATTAATEAYAATLEECEDPATMQAVFEAKFKQKLNTVLNSSALAYAEYIGGKYSFDTDFIKNQITFAEDNELIKNGIVSINYKDFVANTEPGKEDEPAKLLGVEISYVDENGYENIITTDITFKVNLPKTGVLDSSSPFSYEIDHFVMISGGSINPGNSELAQDFIGNLYAFENINIKTKTGAMATPSDWVKMYSQYVLSGKNLNVSGRLSIAPIHLTNFNEAAEVWCDNIYLSSNDAEVKTGDADQSLSTDLYLKGNLELNGKEAKFTGVKGNYYGYSSSDTTYYKPGESDGDGNLKTKPKSSAIILNGLAAKLDLSGLTSLNLAGTAYTALPDATGKVDIYSYYNGVYTEEPSNVYYYSQGDSVTVRSLQALYLIPGDYINGVGHNPMKQSEFSSIAAGSITAPGDLIGTGADKLVTSNIYKSHYVQYLNGETYVYLFWDFKSVDSAITYFNRVTGSNGRYAGLFEKQLGVLGEADGVIKLPATVNTTGYSVKYDSSATPKFGKTGNVATNISGYASEYSGLMTTLNKGSKVGTDIISNMFGDFSGEHSKYAGYSFEGEMIDPYTQYTFNGNTYSYTTTDTRHKYYLITGPNVQLGNVGGGHSGDSNWKVVTTPDSDYTYIIITPGDVELRYSGEFRGMIIAGGDIKINSGLDMECLGMVSRTEKKVDADDNETIQDQTISEFKALLGMAPNEGNLNHPNSRFREIFGVRDSSFEVGGEDSSNFVVVSFEEWVRN